MSRDHFYFQSSEKPKEIIKSIFGMDIPITQGWGYEKENASVIEERDIPLTQLEHTIASIRTHLDMGIIQTKESKYGGINLNETAREELDDSGYRYHKVTYEVTAMLESQYNAFVDEYKARYGQEDFDISGYFTRRREATIKREIVYWFAINLT